MDTGKEFVNLSPVQIPSFCLSPEDAKSSADGSTSGTSGLYEKGINTVLPLPTLDLLTGLLPLTPEDSLNSGPDYDETILLEDVVAESFTPGDLQYNYNSSDLQVDLEVPLQANAQLEPTADLALSPGQYSQTKQADSLSPVLPNTPDHQTFDLFQNQVIGEHETGSLSEMHLLNQNITESQNETGNSAPSSASETVISKSSEMKVSAVTSDSKLKSRATNSLKFPPCVICSGKATGSHYGAITCEACKGFFRRYLQKRIDFKCTKGGNCDIISTKKGNCSACRLKKCLELGMAKGKSKIGRYTLTERTKAITKMKKIEGKLEHDTITSVSDSIPNENEIDANNCNLETDPILRHLILNTKTLNMSDGFNDMLVVELVEALAKFEPYGPDVKTKEQISETHKLHSERYKRKTELFGNMKNVSRDDYDKLYKDFGIDIDGRMADMKLDCEDIERDTEIYCNFAKHIPGFHSLPIKDQLNLLKAAATDFCTMVMIDSYSDEHRTFISKNGHGHHFDEMAGREYSEKLITLTKDVYCRLQMLNLSSEEIALMTALTLVSTDRCKLENRPLVGQIQLSLIELLQVQIKRKDKNTSGRRFTKIIDALTYMREMSDLYIKEGNLLYTDEVYVKEFPFFESFQLEESY